ncbi:hypothetical protein BC628DRAFT_958354 [Trametes gibbosa]|nr:hypothetical protein BC628DRAFT_958354 [Trametes gibbosa]
MVIGARSCTIFLDIMAVIITWRATRTSHKVLGDSFEQPSLQHVMWRNGNVYFVTLLTLNVLDLSLVALSITVPDSGGSYVTLFLDPINTILNCHFLLDLYETNARLERGGPSFSQSFADYSLHFAGLGSGRGDAPADGGSDFLDSFASTIYYSFADDSDVEDAEAVGAEPVDDKSEAGPSDSAHTMLMLIPTTTTTTTTTVQVAGPSSAV